MANLGTGYKGGPLSDYSRSFSGLAEHARLQKPGATQWERLQMTRPMGGTAPVLPNATAEAPFTKEAAMGAAAGTGVSAPAPTSGMRTMLYRKEDYTAPQPLIAPAGLGLGGASQGSGGAGQPPTLPLPETETGINSITGARPVGRSMKDPNRIVETLARRFRGDPQAQLAAANFFQNRADAAGNAQAAQAAAEFDRYKFDVTSAGAAEARAETQRHNTTMEDFRRQEEERRAQEFQQSLSPPELRTLPIPGTSYVAPFAGNKPLGTLPTNAPPEMGMVQQPGTNTYFPTLNGKPDMDRPFAKSPAQKGFGTVLAPGVGGETFTPAPGKQPKPNVQRVQNDKGETEHWEYYQGQDGKTYRRLITEEPAQGAPRGGGAGAGAAGARAGARASGMFMPSVK